MEPFQQLKLAFGLDALRHTRHIQPMAQLDQSRHHSTLPLAVLGAGDQAAVDLDNVQLRQEQRFQTRRLGPHVIQRDGEAPLLEGCEPCLHDLPLHPL